MQLAEHDPYETDDSEQGVADYLGLRMAHDDVAVALIVPRWRLADLGQLDVCDEVSYIPVCLL